MQQEILAQQDLIAGTTQLQQSNPNTTCKQPTHDMKATTNETLLFIACMQQEMQQEQSEVRLLSTALCTDRIGWTPWLQHLKHA